ncbi:MAG: hypothetical protein AB7O26_20255 [Planctomycetaceae bacterium]
MTSRILRSRSFTASLFVALVTVGVGCSSSDSGESAKKGEGEAGAQNAAPAADAQAAAPAANGAAPQDDEKGRRATRKNAKLEEAVAKAKEKDKKGGDKPAAAAAAAPTKLSTENPAEWKMEDLKVALNKKDPRYSAAVAMQGAKSQGDAGAAAGLSELLASVAKMPADGSATQASAKGPARRKRSSKRGGDDEEPADPTAAAPAAAPPAAAAAPQPAAGPHPATQPGFKLNFRRGDDP